MIAKKLIPAPLRLQARVWQRHQQDIRRGHRPRFASQPSPQSTSAANVGQGRSVGQGGSNLGNSTENADPSPSILHQWDITQPIPTTSHSANKRLNLALAIRQLNGVVLQPQQILSFWHLVGAPTRQHGYCEGRAIVGDRLSSEVGGGLCQLSGMLYWLGLQAGLQILERHPHSQDLYTDETRYAPLGSDATVVYGYKDLRLVNNQPLPLSFRFALHDEAVTASLWATQPLHRWTVSFEPIATPEPLKEPGLGEGQTSPESGIWVQTTRHLVRSSEPGKSETPPSSSMLTPRPELVSQTFYRRPPQPEHSG